MKNLCQFFALMIFFVIASSEFEQSSEVYCNQNVFNQIKGIEMNISIEGFSENFNTLQLQKVGQLLICCHFRNEFTDNPENFKGIISIEQLRNQFKFLIDLFNSFENQNDGLTKCLNDLNQLETLQSKHIQYSIEFHTLNETINQQKCFINLIFHQIQESEKGFLTKQNKKLGNEKSEICAHKVIVLMILIAILQSQQFYFSIKLEKQFKTYTQQMKQKILILPFCFQTIIDINFQDSLILEFDSNGLISEIIICLFFLLVVLQNLIFLQNLEIQEQIFGQYEWVQKIYQTKWLYNLVFLVHIALYFWFIPHIGYYYENNIYYQYCFPYIYFPQIIYNFKFHTLKLNWKFLLTQLSTKVFYIVYLKSSPFSSRDSGFNLWVSIINCTAFLIQLLISYLQNLYGPKNLLFKCKNQICSLLSRQNKDICPICLAEISDFACSQYARGQIVTRCKHTYHYSCLQIWYEVQKLCPLCKCINI